MKPGWVKLWRYAVLLVFAWWLGGLTFYATVVVWVGGKVLGPAQQGLVTQQVTIWLNWLGLLVVVLLLLEGIRIQVRVLVAAWLVLAVAQIGLFLLHRRLDALIAAAQTTSFYDWHRAYLWATTAQWLAGLIAYWTVVHGHFASPAARNARNQP